MGPPGAPYPPKCGVRATDGMGALHAAECLGPERNLEMDDNSLTIWPRSVCWPSSVVDIILSWIQTAAASIWLDCTAT